MLSNFYTLNAGETYLGHGGHMQFRRGQERFYNPLPLFHINHLNIMSTAAMQTANTLILTERFSPTRWWHEVSTHGATIIHYLGIVAPMLLNQPPGPADRDHKVRLGLGAGIEPQLHKPFEERFGFPMVELWGMTETGRMTADAHEPRMIGTRAFGRPFAGLEARVVDDTTRTCRSAHRANFSCAIQPRTRAAVSSPATSRTRKPQRRPGAAAGSTPGTSSGRTRPACCSSSTARSTSSAAPARTSPPPRSRPCCRRTMPSRRWRCCPRPTNCARKRCWRASCRCRGPQRDAALAEALFEQCNARLAYFKAPGWVLFLDKLPTTGTQKVQKTQIFQPGEDPRQRAGIIDLRREEAAELRKKR